MPKYLILLERTISSKSEEANVFKKAQPSHIPMRITHTNKTYPAIIPKEGSLTLNTNKIYRNISQILSFEKMTQRRKLN